MIRKIEMPLFMLLLVLVTTLFLWLLKPFFAPILWACIIAILFNPLQHWLKREWGDRPTLIALTTLFVCVVLVVIPVLLLLASFLSEGTALYQRIESGELNLARQMEQVQQAFPRLQSTLENLGVNVASLRESASTAALAVSRFLAENALAVSQSTFVFFLKLGLMLYMAFFLLRDGRALIDVLIRAIPLGDARERLLFHKFAEVTRATVKGNLVVAIIQGTLGGIIFWILGIPAAVLWGVVMVVLSLVPVLGAPVIWVPVAVYLLATGDVVRGFILVVYGFVIIGLADNLLRPVLVGRDTKLPDWLVLLSTLGGFVMFGVNGFVVGPLIAALFITFWKIFGSEFSMKNNPDPPPNE